MSISYIKGAGDIVSLSTIISTLLNQMPNIAALFALIWTLIRIWETETFQTLWKKWKNKE